ncbi:MAG: formate dehydrogenase subunit gamma [Porticoccaceae bacterium]|nr:formate dehydrogenase subunit gamma [Porticoccaceae bacterium]
MHKKPIYKMPITEGSPLHSETIERLLTSYKIMPGGLLPLLHAIQSEIGYIPKTSVSSIARGLNLSRADVHGVISFYHDFKTQPVGRHRVQICRAEACQSMGSRQLEEHAHRTLAIDYHQTTADGQITLEPVYCLGNCACSPSVRIDDDVYARVDTQRFDTLIAALTSTQ